METSTLGVLEPNTESCMSCQYNHEWKKWFKGSRVEGAMCFYYPMAKGKPKNVNFVAKMRVCPWQADKNLKETDLKTK